MKPACIPCRRFFEPTKNNYPFIEAMPIVDRARPGTRAPEEWQPYKLWLGDRWTCPGCGAEIIVGVGRGPIAEHYDTGRFAAMCASYPPQVTINDC